MRVLSVLAAANGSVQSPYTSEFLMIRTTGTAVPTKLEVTVNGYDNTVNLDTNGIIILGSQLQESSFTWANGSVLMIADGLLKTRGCNISLTMGAGTGQGEIYMFSDSQGQYPVSSSINTINANTSQVFDSCLLVGAIDSGNTDILNANYLDGTSVQATPFEYGCINRQLTNTDGAVYPVGVYVIPNYDQVLTQVSIQPSATRNVYVQKICLTK